MTTTPPRKVRLIKVNVPFNGRLKHLACAALIGGGLGIFLLPAAAQADGYYRWQSAATNNYLEVWQSSMANDALVITYPYNGNSANQVWYDNKLSDGRYMIRNSNSGMALDKDEWGDFGNGFGNIAGCAAVQWSPTTASRDQHWHYRELYSPKKGRIFIGWSNLNGCRGDSYWSMLGTVDQASNAALYQQDDCSETVHSWGPHTFCYWKKDGQ